MRCALFVGLLALSIVGLGRYHTAVAWSVDRSLGATSIVGSLPASAKAFRMFVRNRGLGSQRARSASVVSDVLCSTSIQVHQSFGKNTRGRYALLSWLAEESCPVAIYMRGTSSARTSDGKHSVARGTSYGSIRTRNGRSAGGYVTSLRRQQRLLNYVTLKTAPPDLVWAPSPAGLDTRGVDQKTCVGYGTKVLACRFSRSFTTGVG